MEAPVKLIGPLMMFIFPVTFIVIGFPIAMKYMSSGMM
jgi:tight adherence protein C